jgi:predicted DsbA family dithiol-disulfide isomerase
MQERLRIVGRQEGIEFSFAGKIGRTRDSHRLIQLAKGKGAGVENAVVLELFKSYFEGEGDVTSHETLVDVGVSGGLEREEVRAWLESGKGGEEVDAEVDEAAEKGIRGVPNFTIQDQYEVDGAQDAQEFMEAFVKAKEAEQL